MLVSSVGGSVNLAADEADIAAISIQATDATGGIDIDCGSLGLDVLATGGPISIDAEGTMNVTTTGAFDLTVESTLGSLILQSGEAVLDAIQMTTAAGGGIAISAGTTGLTIDSTDLLSIDSAGVTNITATGAFDITVNSTAGSVILDGGEAAVDAVQITSSAVGSGIDINANTGGLTIDSGDLVSIQGAAASDFSTSAGDLTLESTAGSVVITAGESVADAIQLTASGAAGAIDFNVAAGAAIGVFDADGARFPSNYRLSAARTGGGHVVGAGNIVIFNTEAFDPGADYDNATGIYTCPITAIYRVSAVVNCTDVVGGGVKTITLRDNAAATNYAATATVGNTEVGSLSLDVLYAGTAGQTLDIYFAGGAGDTANDYSHLNIEVAYRS